MAVASGGVVTTVQADAAASPAGQLVQLHVEATAAGVQVAVAGWAGRETADQQSTQTPTGTSASH